MYHDLTSSTVNKEMSLICKSRAFMSCLSVALSVDEIMDNDWSDQCVVLEWNSPSNSENFVGGDKTV